MTNDTKNKITDLLFGIMQKAEKLPSIEEKKNFYLGYLERNVDYIDSDEVIDPHSEEVEELITDKFLTIEVDKPKIFEDEGYVPWLQDARKDINWQFYDRYERYLLDYKRWKPKAIADLKKTSDIILDHMANPKSEKLFNKKGLVIGDIQSGKTANYTAVINKAIDAGYKIVIVFAGLTRDLRNQTQNRLDSEVLGYETKTHGKGNNIGVGLVHPLNIEGLTYADEKKDFGDMKKFFSVHTLDKDVKPIVAIVKKNKSVLGHLDRFLTQSQSSCYTDGKLDIPVLIIDDEVDQASVDTKDAEEAENASAINKMIRTILSHLNRYSYVGYTATPFANVFVNPDREDIYPKDFILCLPTNEDYCGIKEYFGVDALDEKDDSSDHVHDLFVNISDFKDLFATEDRINAQTSTDSLNGSLKDAIMSFIIAASIKKSRGIEGFNSMLIHIARFKNPSTTLKPLVSDYIDDLYNNLKYSYENTVKEYKQFWEDKFAPVSKTRLGDDFKDNWDSIKNFLMPTIESIQMNIKVVNGDSEDLLDYSSTKSGDYIVIGGDKLSRGLTLEGLVVSYYYRRSRTYDSLLQMGRWFGYRGGWIDVCRVFTTVNFMNDFITVGKVLQRFKADVQEMYDMHLNPREVGQRIMYSPNLIPTARNKMKTTTKIKISFSGGIQQIITFDRNFREDNLELTRNFIASLGKGEVRPNRKVVFKGVSSNTILNYLKKYKDCSNYYDYGHISIRNWIKYIENLNLRGELKEWTIVLNSLQTEKADNKINIGGYEIYKASRTLRDDGDSSAFKFYTIKTNNDPTDFREVFDPVSKEYAETDHYNPEKDYPGFDSTKGVMAIYVVDLYEKILTKEFDPKTNKQKTIRGKLIEDGRSMCAPAIWFSKTKDYESSATTYYVSKDYLEREKMEEADDEDEEMVGGETNA